MAFVRRKKNSKIFMVRRKSVAGEGVSTYGPKGPRGPSARIRRGRPRVNGTLVPDEVLSTSRAGGFCLNMPKRGTFRRGLTQKETLFNFSLDHVDLQKENSEFNLKSLGRVRITYLTGCI